VPDAYHLRRALAVAQFRGIAKTEEKKKNKKPETPNRGIMSFASPGCLARPLYPITSSYLDMPHYRLCCASRT